MKRGAAIWAVVPAAGRGSRFKHSTPKQYLPLCGRPVLSWSLRTLLAEPAVRRVIVAVSAGDRRWRRLPEASNPRVERCIGGAERADSVAAGLTCLAEVAESSDWVLVHDAARPCLAASDLRHLIATLADDPVGGLLAVPVDDTLKLADDHDGSVRTLPREALWRALTPQMFRYGLLRRALGLCRDRGRPVTDEASAIEALGLRPRLVHGRSDNLKVTMRADLDLAAAVLGGRS